MELDDKWLDVIKQRTSIIINDLHSVVVSHGDSGRINFDEIVCSIVSLVQMPIFISLYIGEKDDVNGSNLVFLWSSYKGESADIREGVCGEKPDICELIRINPLSKLLDYSVFIKAVRVEFNGELHKAIPIKMNNTCSALDKYVWSCLYHIVSDDNDAASSLVSQRFRDFFWHTALTSLFETLEGKIATLKLECLIKRSTLTSEQQYIELERYFNKRLDTLTDYFSFDSILYSRNEADKNIVKKKIDSHRQKWFEEIIPAGIETVLRKMTRTVDYVSHRLSLNTAIPNYFVMARCFAPADIRSNDSLPYNIYMILDSEQKKSITNLLETLREESWKAKRFFDFPEEIEQHGKQRESLLRSLDDWFWEMIEKREYASLIEAFSCHVTSCSESFTDIVFKSGQSYVRYPLSRSGLYRIKNIELHDGLVHHTHTKDKNLRMALYRAVCYHYIMTSMAANFDNKEFLQDKELILLLYPIEVGGSVWCVVGNLIYQSTNSEKRLLNHEHWNSTYHYLSTARLKFGRNIRRKLQDVHLNEIEEIYKEVFKRLVANESEEALVTFLSETSKNLAYTSGLPFVSPYKIPVFTSTKEGNAMLKMFAEKEIQNQKYEILISDSSRYPLKKLLTISSKDENGDDIALMGKLENSYFPIVPLKRNYISLARYQAAIERAWNSVITAEERVVQE